jgi:hypothetical protein
MDLSNTLGQLPSSLRDELLKVFNEIISNFREGRWEPSELNGGKLCEVVYTILKGHVESSYPQRSSKPTNMVAACQNLANAPQVFPRSVRIQVPRILIALYEVRNNRGVGHVGGEVDPNHMDALLIVHFSKWIMAELVRIFHNVDVNTATTTVEALTERDIPLIWHVNGRKRVLNNKLSMKAKTLLLLYSTIGSVDETDLVNWTEHTNIAVYRRDILVKGHRDNLWEYDRITKKVTLSPLGANYVENHLL